MPSLTIPTELLKKQLKSLELTSEELIINLQKLGCDIEGYENINRYKCLNCGGINEAAESEETVVRCDSCGVEFKDRKDLLSFIDKTEVVKMELLPVRADIFDPGGIGRALRSYLSVEKGLKKYKTTEGNFAIEVDSLMNQPTSYRPYIVAAIIKNIKFSTETIKVLMKLQENIHWAVGRDRKFASIGVYDLDTLKSNKIFYKAADPDNTCFVPLGWQENISMKKIIEQHPKGVAFAHLVKDLKKFPFLVDEKGVVLSFPPIINSEDTKVSIDSKNLFIDVTGINLNLINKALNIMVTSLVEIDPEITVEKVKIKYNDKILETPDLQPETRKFDKDYAKRIMGIDLTDEELIDLFARMGFDAQKNGKDFIVQVPCYRKDIMHNIDLVEDLIMAYGYDNLMPQLVSTYTTGNSLPVEDFSNTVRKIMTGLGFIEVLNLPLTNESSGLSFLVSQDKIVKIANPISVEQTIVRPNLLGGLLETFGRNTHNPLPQHIFEIGDVSLIDKNSETGVVENRHLCVAMSANQIGFAEIRSVIQTLFKELNICFEIEPNNFEIFIKGRSGNVVISKNNEKINCGFIGEIHPEIIEKFKLRHPVVLMEINISDLLMHNNNKS